jgi:transposase
MNTREAKGRELARRGMVEQRDDGYWLVISQSRSGKYLVDVDGEPPTCTCPDYELSGLRCKHIYAVEYVQRGMPDDGCTEKPKRPTYRQDWPAYNTAQTNEKALFQELLHQLCQHIEEAPQAMGRPRHAAADLLFATAFKVYSTVSARRFACDLADAHIKGYLRRPIHHSSVFRAFEDATLTTLLYGLIEVSSRPMKAIETRFAVDSSGFTTTGYVRWFDVKYGNEEDWHDWLKVHLMCGVTTNIVTSVEITGKDGADYSQFGPMVEDTARTFTIEEVSADKAYNGRSTLRVVAKHGGTAYIPFKTNAKARMSSMDLWDQAYYFYHLHRETFLQHYHKRSLSESTFWMIKAKFGTDIRSKTGTAQVNELLCKVLWGQLSPSCHAGVAWRHDTRRTHR